MKLFKNALMTGLMLATAAPMIIPAAAQAQSRGELRQDRKDIREEQRDVRQAQRHGTARDVREERRDVREARQEYREDRRDYREDRREDRREYREDRREYRQDLRDHRNHRASNRNAYRGTRFSANFRYQNFRPGARMNTHYYAPRYIMNNYRSYRLPRPGAHQAWVRHYNDVLLVNIRTGRVLRAIPNFYY